MCYCTGDNAVTGASIARQCGILPPNSRPAIGLPTDLAAAYGNGSAAHSASQNGSSSSISSAQSNGASSSSSAQQPISSSNGSSSETMPHAAAPQHGNANIAASASGSDLQCNDGQLAQRRLSSNGASTSELASDDDCIVLEGPQFREAVLKADGSINKQAFEAIWPRLRVLGRCSPKDKYTIVRGEADSQG